ncbi:MAG: YbaK/EbsC family protein [Acetobacteraceae bacterium]|nr:YbaK/EbsC family protein [Acetobacteraceae bacterium]
MAAGGSSVERVREALLAAGHPDSIAEFPAGTRSAADAAAAIGCSVAQIAKSLVFRSGERPVLVLASGAVRVDESRLSAVLGRPVARAEGRWVREVTGFAIGGVAPVGHLTPPLAVLDEGLMALDPLWAAAGSPAHVFRTDGRALLRLTGGVVAAIAAP